MGRRPVFIVQNDVGNRFSPTTMVAAMTSRLKRPGMPVHVVIQPGSSGLGSPRMVLCEQLFTLPRDGLQSLIGRASAEEMRGVDRALAISLALE